MLVMIVMIWLVNLQRVLLALGIAPEAFIANGVSTPIVMVFYPVMKMVQALAAQRQPDIARCQIVKFVTDESDVLRAVPSI